MANERNIEPHRFTSAQNREEAARNGHKGGIASGKAKRERKALISALDLILSVPAASGDLEQLEAMANLNELEAANLSVQDKIALALVQKAMNGDTKAFELIRDTVGEKPADKVRVDVQGEIEGAANRIRSLIEQRNSERRRIAELLAELAEIPDLPPRASECANELLKLV